MSKSNLIRFSWVFWFISLALVLSGCATTATNIKEASELNQVGKDSSIVFGRILWLENGKAKKIGKGILAMSLLPLLIKMEDKTRIKGEVTEGGNFVWSLKAGAYRIHRIGYRDPWTGNYYVDLNVAFSVPENGKVYYVGILRSEFEKKRFLGIGLSGEVRFTIQDEGDRDFVEFQDKFNIPSKDIKKSLMIVR